MGSASIQRHQQDNDAPRAVHGELEGVFKQIRQNFAAIVEAVCGGSPRAQDVTDSFAVHRKLGWQVWNVIYTADPLAAIRFMPNARSLDVFRSAAARQGVPEDLLGRLDRAVEQFEQLVQVHAEDREMLEMLVESAAPHPDEAADVRWRKQAFTGNTYIWGVRAKRLLATLLLHPSQRAGYFDMVRLHGLIGLVRTRNDVRWPFAQSVVQTKDGKEHAPKREPLLDTPAVRELGVPLMEPFCSQPLPAVQRRAGQQGMIEDELLPGPVGQTGASTIITGELLREVAPVCPARPGQVALFGAGVRTPGEVLVSDQLVHREMFPGVVRDLRVFGELISNITQDERDRLPVPERVHYLGRGLERVRTAEVPRYAEILEAVFDRTGWKAEDFDVYRVRMRYPPIPISVMFRYELPRAGADAPAQ